MSTLRESLGYVEGVVDVSIIVPACFQNPLKEYAVDFLTKVLTLKTRDVIPVTAVLGAYHIATRYLKAPKLPVKKVLEGMLRTKSPALHPHVPPELATDSLDYATVYNIESWDGYLIALARNLGTKTVCSMDEELTRVGEIRVVNPFPKDKTREYHQWIKAKKK